MKLFSKTINGILTIKTLNQIVISNNGMNTYNPTEEMALSDGWSEYKEPVVILTESELLQQTRSNMLQQIEKYDRSSEVNVCYIRYGNNMFNYWANKTERSSLKAAVQDCINMGREKYRLDLRELGLSMEVSCKDLMNMLGALEIYAIDCYNKTTDHMYAVQSLTTIEEIERYEYYIGYPDKLIFDL